MARPRKGEEKHADERVGFRIPSWVRDGLDRLSAKRRAALSDIATEAFVAYLDSHGIKQPEKSPTRPASRPDSRSAPPRSR